jgi:hypothetical protein
MASTIELYAPLYPTPCQMVLLLESWLFAAQRDGMATRSPASIEALARAINALRFCDTVEKGIALLKSEELSLE